VTYRDTGQLLTPGLYAVLLSYFALPVVFATAAMWMLVAAGFCRYIPRRLRWRWPNAVSRAHNRCIWYKQLITGSLSSKGYLGWKSAKGVPKRQKMPFCPSVESLGAFGVLPRYTFLGSRRPDASGRGAQAQAQWIEDEDLKAAMQSLVESLKTRWKDKCSKCLLFVSAKYAIYLKYKNSKINC
jgi:hypothetical protein